MMKRMVAAKSFFYGTRALRAGDEFDVQRPTARLLVAVGRAREAVVPAEPEETVETLRAKAKEAGIKKIDARWGIARLKAEIEAACASSD
jgi:hypothetical protein